jgi:hypothetical protein
MKHFILMALLYHSPLTASDGARDLEASIEALLEAAREAEHPERATEFARNHITLATKALKHSRDNYALIEYECLGGLLKITLTNLMQSRSTTSSRNLSSHENCIAQASELRKSRQIILSKQVDLGICDHKGYLHVFKVSYDANIHLKSIQRHNSYEACMEDFQRVNSHP